MPCYDKKLEASRSDFYSSMYSTRDVDCVLTTGEFDLLLQDLNFDPYALTPHDSHGITPTDASAGDLSYTPFPELLDHPGSSSGSYLTTIVSHLAMAHPNPTYLTTRSIRNSSDNVEFILTDSTTGEIIFKGAKCYGFRNLQNLVRKVNKETGLSKGRGTKLSLAVAARRRRATGQGEVRTPATDSEAEGPSRRGSVAELIGALGADDKKLDFVEVMACPGGCVNGGGQMKPSSVPLDEEGYTKAADGTDEGMRWSTKEWVAKVESLYWSGLPTPPPSPILGAINARVKSVHRSPRLVEADRFAEEIVRKTCGDDPSRRWEFLRTRYRRVEGDVLSGGVTGVTHEQVKW